MAILTDPDIRYFFVMFLILALTVCQVAFAYLLVKQAKHINAIWADLSALAMTIDCMTVENKDTAG